MDCTYLYNDILITSFNFRLCNEIILKLAEKSGLGLKYNPVWLATSDKGVNYFVENYLVGDTWKAVNNTGQVNQGRGFVDDEGRDYQELSQAFSHFSLQDSNEQWAALDIQGVGSTLMDPCMASVEPGLFDKANCGIRAIHRFKREHICNEYCKRLFLTKL